MSEPAPSTNDQLRRAIAEQKSFVGPALVVLLLYLACYVPGLVFNLMWMNEARSVRKITGKSPRGSGCLTVMFLVGMLPWLLLFLIIIVIPNLSAVNERSRDLKQQQEVSTKSTELTGDKSSKLAASSQEPLIPKTNVHYLSRVPLKIYPSTAAAPPTEWQSGEVTVPDGYRFLFLEGPRDAGGESWHPIRVTSPDGRDITAWFRGEQLSQVGVLEAAP